MFKFPAFALLSVVLLCCSPVDAQLFRRFAAPRQLPPPAQQYSPQVSGYRAQGAYSSPQQTYYKRVQVAPGRFAFVPVQPNGGAQQGGATPQDIARKQAKTTAENRKAQAAPQLEGPKSNSQVADRSRPSPGQASQQTQNAQTPNAQPQKPQQMYRRVTVYNSRTGQRSIRLIPIPSSQLAQQPYTYGQNRQGQGSANTNVVNGKLLPPVQVPNVPTGAAPIRLDSQVRQTTFNESSVQPGQPSVALVTPTVVQQRDAAVVMPVVPEPGSASDSSGDVGRQHSVLEFGDDVDRTAAEVGSLELAAPAN
jgi:hypothetical protein